MEAFSLRKVVDPHENMPKDVRDAFMKAFATGEHSNDSFINWYVGEYQGAEDSYEPEKFKRLKVVDDWAVKNFDNGERVLILFWW